MQDTCSDLRYLLRYLILEIQLFQKRRLSVVTTKSCANWNTHVLKSNLIEDCI